MVFFLSLLHVFDVTKNKTIVVSTTISWWQLRKIFCTLELLKMFSIFFVIKVFLFYYYGSSNSLVKQQKQNKKKNFSVRIKKSKNIDVNQICCPLWTALLNKLKNYSTIYGTLPFCVLVIVLQKNFLRFSKFCFETIQREFNQSTGW